jgi:hypothetical protein
VAWRRCGSGLRRRGRRQCHRAWCCQTVFAAAEHQYGAMVIGMGRPVGRNARNRDLYGRSRSDAIVLVAASVDQRIVLEAPNVAHERQVGRPAHLREQTEQRRQERKRGPTTRLSAGADGVNGRTGRRHGSL